MTQEEEVKKLLKDRIPLHGERELDLCFIDLLVQDVCKLFSPPPVVGELRDKIARLCNETEVAGYSVLWENLTSVSQDKWLRKADSILAIIKEAGYVRLSENQMLPMNPYVDDQLRLRLAYEQGQHDMTKTGWRKIA